MHLSIQSDLKDTLVEKLGFLYQTLGPPEKFSSKHEIEAISLVKEEAADPEGDDKENKDNYFDCISCICCVLCIIECFH